MEDDILFSPYASILCEDVNVEDEDIDHTNDQDNDDITVPFSKEDITNEYKIDGELDNGLISPMDISNEKEIKQQYYGTNNTQQLTKEEEQWHCFMMVVDKTSNNNNTGKSKHTSPNRTILGVSQDPYCDLDLYNSYGPSRNTSNSKTVFFNKNCGWVDINEISPLLSDNNLHYKTSMAIKKKKRKRKNNGPKYNIGMVITGFTSCSEAQKFCHLWNTKSRGPIPRAGWGILLASRFELKVFADFRVVLDEPLKYYDLVYHGSNIVIKRKPSILEG